MTKVNGRWKVRNLDFGRGLKKAGLALIFSKVLHECVLEHKEMNECLMSVKAKIGTEICDCECLCIINTRITSQRMLLDKLG